MDTVVVVVVVVVVVGFVVVVLVVVDDVSVDEGAEPLSFKITFNCIKVIKFTFQWAILL